MNLRTALRRSALTVIGFVTLAQLGTAVAEVITLRCEGRQMQKSAPKTVALAVVIDEQAEQVYLQGRQLDEVKFGSDKIEAKRLVHYPDGKFTNLGVEFWLSINRVTGAFSYRGLPTTTDGSELSPAKAASLPLPPKLEGTCKPESS